ncbi:hypothetical protein GCM10022215_24020 [Nocardioides fonticola]|uniref:Uncharacterized protein n=1 Tax=Nocardioides fonticola TaxID=450363 RepID=A0ABP7XJR4_9ACTN
MSETDPEPLDDRTPLEKLTDAIREFVNAIDDEAPVLIRGAVVTWESTILTEDGDAAFKVGYASCEGSSMASTIGMLELARRQAVREMLDEDGNQ